MYQVNFLPWRIARQQARYRFWRNTMLIQGIGVALYLVLMQARSEHKHRQGTAAALSQQIPERCWLMALRQQGDVLSFEVISRDYATINAFLAMLGRQPLLVNVSLQGITQQDEGGFRFVVHASWRDENHHVEGHHAEGHDIDGHHVAGDYE
ncbi:Fimbrial assembly protein (PilN) [Yersinia pseudotuberculosis]|nr:Fimbrial assembly protein (PilN) [Yersinia pseudotuberculosis]